MSTADGDAKIVADVVADAKALLAGATQDAEQLDMLEPVSPEDMLWAREDLGPSAGNVSVLRHAREKRRGRPAGARNKRTDDFVRWISGFGQHPAITLMQIQSTPPEVLIENSRREVARATKHGFVDVPEAMTYEAAQSLRVRCAEALMPYLESKKPVAVDMTFSGVADLFIEGVTHSAAEIADVVDADFLDVDESDAA